MYKVVVRGNSILMWELLEKVIGWFIEINDIQISMYVFKWLCNFYLTLQINNQKYNFSQVNNK